MSTIQFSERAKNIKSKLVQENSSLEGNRLIAKLKEELEGLRSICKLGPKDKQSKLNLEHELKALRVNNRNKIERK